MTWDESHPEAYAASNPEADELAAHAPAASLGQGTAAIPLLHEASLFQTFLANSPLASCLEDVDGRYLFRNPRHIEVFGDRPQPPPGISPANAAMQETTQTVQQSDGSLTHWRSFRFPCVDVSSRVLIGTVAVDITAEVERGAELARYQAQLEAANDRLRDLVVTDELTGLRNRRAFEERLAIEFSMARRKLRDLTIVLVDADDFKKVNDELGHPAGDVVLQQLAAALRDTVRLTDLAVRLGGEEFAVILPENDERGGLLWCGRFQKALASLNWELHPITVSMGAASLTPACVDGNHLVAMADQALYRAKRLGKNRSVGASELTAASTG